MTSLKLQLFAKPKGAAHIQDPSRPGVSICGQPLSESAGFAVVAHSDRCCGNCERMRSYAQAQLNRAQEKIDAQLEVDAKGFAPKGMLRVRGGR